MEPNRKLVPKNSVLYRPLQVVLTVAVMSVHPSVQAQRVVVIRSV